jgi:hypothetical protein
MLFFCTTYVSFITYTYNNERSTLKYYAIHPLVSENLCKPGSTTEAMNWSSYYQEYDISGLIRLYYKTQTHTFSFFRSFFLSFLRGQINACLFIKRESEPVLAAASWTSSKRCVEVSADFPWTSLMGGQGPSQCSRSRSLTRTM